MAEQALIDVLTTARADVGYSFPIAQAIADQPGLRVRPVLVGDVDFPDLDDFEAPVRIPAPGLGDGVIGSGRGVGALVSGFTELWAQNSPALVLLPCDRFEVLGPATAAIMHNLAIGHLYGGEEDVAYSIDTRIRNALTKLAHVHFVMHDAVKQRLLSMGEEDWRIFVCGASSISDITPDSAPFLEFACEQGWGKGPFISATYLPLTTFRGQTLFELDAMITALTDFSDHTIVWNSVNLDPGNNAITERLHALGRETGNHVFVENLGSRRYFSLLSCAKAMVGNSSSGLLEAPSFGIPVVNVGLRQTGRLGGENVLFVPGEANAIRDALHRALNDDGFRNRIARTPNPFAKPHAPQIVAQGIAEMLRLPPARFLIKRSVAGNPAQFMGLPRSTEFPPLAQSGSE